MRNLLTDLSSARRNGDFFASWIIATYRYGCGYRLARKFRDINSNRRCSLATDDLSSGQGPLVNRHRIYWESTGDGSDKGERLL